MNLLAVTADWPRRDLARLHVPRRAPQHQSARPRLSAEISGVPGDTGQRSGSVRGRCVPAPLEEGVGPERVGLQRTRAAIGLHLGRGGGYSALERGPRNTFRDHREACEAGRGASRPGAGPNGSDGPWAERGRGAVSRTDTESPPSPAPCSVVRPSARYPQPGRHRRSRTVPLAGPSAATEPIGMPRRASRPGSGGPARPAARRAGLLDPGGRLYDSDRSTATSGYSSGAP
jgi:hypothetical protein